MENFGHHLEVIVSLLIGEHRVGLLRLLEVGHRAILSDNLNPEIDTRNVSLKRK